MNKKLSILTLFSFLSIFSSIILHAHGMIIIDPIIFPVEPKRLVLKSHHVVVSIDKQVATTKIDQVFLNPNGYTIEGKYLFPISREANISKFTMLVNQKPVQAKMYLHDEAREIYDTIVRTQKDPALLEYRDFGVLEASLYPVASNATIQISLEYTEILKADNAAVKYQYALGCDKFTRQPVDDVSVTMNIGSDVPISCVYSPTHTISVETISHKKTVVTYKDSNVFPDHDFIVYYTTPKEPIGMNVITYKEGQEDGFFLALASPNNDRAQLETAVSKNLIFVLDTSGSMYGEKMEQAKNALLFCLQHLDADDCFNIISFNSTVTSYQNKLVRATDDNIKKAKSYTKKTHASGGTDIDCALQLALKQLSSDDKPNMIIFLTDGQPTQGECNTSKIIHNTVKANNAKTRIFSFGVGYDVNTTLLDKMSLDNKGASDYVSPQESIESKVSQFYLKVSHPVLTDISLAFRGTEVKELYPIVLPDLFLGSQLVVVGRYTHGGDVQCTLKGKRKGVKNHYPLTAHFADNDAHNDFLPRIWAGRKIAHLIDQVILQGDKQKEVIDSIICLSKKYGIMTPYTSFLIDSDVPDLRDAEAQVSARMKAAMRVPTGQASFERAEAQQMLRNSTSAFANTHQDVYKKMRFVGTRTFYQKEGVWIDAEHTDASSLTKIKLFSVEYFEVLKKYPQYAAAFALGTQVIIKAPDCSYSISE